MSKPTEQANAAAVCEECGGHGYDARHVEGAKRSKGFKGVEIERCGACDEDGSDMYACIRFVEDLECHDQHALLQLADILSKPALSIVLRAILDDEEGYAGS